MPANPLTGSEWTFSIQSSLYTRFDYTLPCGLFCSNIASSQVFRTDLLANPPAPLQTNDDRIASDHLPVLMSFANLYNKPFRLISITPGNQTVGLTRESVLGQSYQVESSTNLAAWPVLASNLTATGAVFHFSATVAGGAQFFRVRRIP